jgi:hypothetical protein
MSSKSTTKRSTAFLRQKCVDSAADGTRNLTEFGNRLGAERSGGQFFADMPDIGDSSPPICPILPEIEEKGLKTTINPFFCRVS